MGKRRADADSRRFFDEFERVRVSRFRALGLIDPSRNHAIIPMGGKDRLLNVNHMAFPNGGGWSFFVCPKCARRAATLWVIEDAPMCWKCCNKLNVHHRSRMGFGRATRLETSDKKLDELIAKVETTERLFLKPPHKTNRGRRALISGSRKLTERMRRRMITLRLGQLANQQARSRAADNAKLVTMQPAPEARALIDLSEVWQANTPETLNQALDKAQITIIKALESQDPMERLYAAKLMLRTKQARQRGL